MLQEEDVSVSIFSICMSDLTYRGFTVTRELEMFQENYKSFTEMRRGTESLVIWLLVTGLYVCPVL